MVPTFFGIWTSSKRVQFQLVVENHGKPTAPPSVTRWKAAAVPPLSLAPSSQGPGEMPSGNIGVVSGDLQVTSGLM